jgi:peptidyl-prolyl cis-trans isomerase SurA
MKLLNGNYKTLVLLIFMCVGGMSSINAQVVADEVIAVVGKHIVLKSDLQNSYHQYRAQKGLHGSEQSVKCQILEGLLVSKLLLHHGEIDSVEVSDAQVSQSMDMRMNYFMQQFGSEKAMEEYYGKPVSVIREEMSEMVKEQMVADRKQGEIVMDINITPSEVRMFFDNIEADSIPNISSTYEIAQITRTPVISQEVKDQVFQRMESFRERILKGESFETLAILYSEDPGSAKKGGETGLTKRGNWDPNFEMAAFNLKEGDVSEIVESQFGYHILKFVERRGDFVNVKHILLMVKPSYEDIAKAHNFLDSIGTLIKADSVKFEDAVRKFSDHPGRISGGYIINQNSGNSQFREEQLDPAIAYTVKRLKVDEISSPVAYKNKDQKDAYRLLMIKRKTLPHKANMSEDYDLIQNWALDQKKQKAIELWAAEKIKKTYVRINKEYRSCDWLNSWVK